MMPSRRDLITLGAVTLGRVSAARWRARAKAASPKLAALPEERDLLDIEMCPDQWRPRRGSLRSTAESR
jgi:hypothetical protein